MAFDDAVAVECEQCSVYGIVVVANACCKPLHFWYTAGLRLTQPACQRLMCAALDHVSELERQPPDCCYLGILLGESLNKALDVTLIAVDECGRAPTH
ncbi:hypothetical protein B0O95_1512 [Mycetohabitans endofungorum]|uniref:Uncharacterized protein n=1 Tax=Mycetohabitans endofungorum TaxID=417203 RepID=A0A2P5K6E5_9BURK|nr:hypothetical protein B0O95_1512 [Mycetohabitans endofungorum]